MEPRWSPREDAHTSDAACRGQGGDLHIGHVRRRSSFNGSEESHCLVHSDVMRRVCIYLSDDDIELLDRAASRTGASRSELIRRAIRARYSGNWEARIAALKASTGAWNNRPFTGEQYVDAIRGDLNERLERLRWF